MSTTELSASEVRSITIIQQICSVLSLTGCLFIIITFCVSNAFHKPINRLVFFASFGNIMASICFIMADSFVDSPEGSGCQTQALLLQTFVQADALWTLAMAINVYLVFYCHFDAQRLKRMDLFYLIICYGIPFFPALVFVFIKNSNGQRVYGSAIQWCWIVPSWNSLRMGSFYGPIWGVITISLLIYIRSGITVYRKRRQIVMAQEAEPDFGEALRAHSMMASYIKTTEITITSQPASRLDSFQHEHMGHQAYAHVSKSTNDSDESKLAQVTTRTNKTIRQNSLHPFVLPRNHSYKVAWAYTRVAILFFAVILITWIPSSANRMYSHVHHNEISKPLMFMSATVLPLQGLWNAVIYAVTSWTACKALLEERGIWRARTRLNEPSNWTASNGTIELGKRPHKNIDDSESLRGFAYPGN